MIWAPSGPAVAGGTAPTPAQFDTRGEANAGGVAWVFNNTGTSQTFTLGNSSMTTNSQAIPLGPFTGMFVGYGPSQTYVIASVNTVVVTPGVSRQ